MRVGYVSGLARTPGVEILANMSVGSSHSVLAPMVMRDDVLDQADFAIFDLTINEQRALNKQMYNLDTMREVFAYILARCRRHGVIPVFLLMPMCLFQDGYPILGDYRDLCERHGVFYVDPSERVMAEAAKLDRTWADLFLDHHHLVSDLAEQIGQRLGEVLQAVDLAPGAMTSVAAPDFAFIPAAPFAGDLQVIDRATALIAGRLVRLTPGDSLTLSIGDSAAVAGIALNMSRTSANLRLEGRTRMVKRLAHPNYDAKGGLKMVVWQVLNPLEAAGGQVVLTCLADRKDDRVESNDHYARHIVRPDPEVELAGLIVRSSAAPTELDWQGYARPAISLL